MDNRHPADELLDLRAQRTALDQRIDELRAEIIDLPEAERCGRVAVTRVVTQQRGRLNLERVRYEMGQKWVDERSDVSIVTIVKVPAA